jgi:hypothetical protein
MLTSAHHLMSDGLWSAHGIKVKTAIAAFLPTRDPVLDAPQVSLS